MRRSFFLVVLLLAGLLLVPAPAWAAGYQGASQWAVPELDKALDYGLITDSIRGKMNAPITREEFAEIAVKLYENGTGDIAEAVDTSVFVDTRNPEVFKAYTMGIVSGTDAGRRLFSPKALITREQVAAMLYRTVNAMGIREDGIAFAFFKDDEQIAAYAREAVHYMGGNEFILGSAGYFNPRGTCTREMATLIATRVFESAGAGNSRPLADDPVGNDNYYEEPYADDYNNEDYSDPGYYGDELSDNPQHTPNPTPNPTPQPGNGDSGEPSGNQPSLPESMVNIFPLLSDAQIAYMDEWDGGDGMVVYTSNCSILKANEFYKDPTLYNNFIQIETHGDALEVLTNGLQYVIYIRPNPWNIGGPTWVQLSAFWYVPAN